MDTLKKFAGEKAGLLEAMKDKVTCAQVKAFMSTVCDVGHHAGLDLKTNCCHTCAPDTQANQQTTAAPTNPPRTTAGSNKQPRTTTNPRRTQARTTAAQTNPPRTKPPKKCVDDESTLNAVIDGLLALAGSGAVKDNELVKQLISLKRLRGDAGFKCSEAKLFLSFAGKTCTESLDSKLDFKLVEYCCNTCEPAAPKDFSKCDTTQQKTCQDRARCDTGYTRFITAINEHVVTLPFTPSQLYCLIEDKLGQFDNSPAMDWKKVADIFASNGGGSACLAALGPFADAVKNLIGQLPAALPVASWSGIGHLVGKACSAMTAHEESYDTLLQAIPDNAEDYNRMVSAIADIIEGFLKKDPDASMQTVIDYLVQDYDWGQVSAHISYNEFLNGDSAEVKQAKVLARVFNAAVAKTTDFTSLYRLMQQVVNFVFESSDDVLAALDKVRKNEILGYADTKACVRNTLNTVRQYCSSTNTMFSQAEANARPTTTEAAAKDPDNTSEGGDDDDEPQLAPSVDAGVMATSALASAVLALLALA